MGGYKYVVVDSHGIPQEYYYIQEEMFKKAGIECILKSFSTPEEALEYASVADALGVVGMPIMRDFLKHLKKCKVIVRFGIGYDNIDIEAATEFGIKIANLPIYCIDEVATHTMALFLDLLRKTTMLDRLYRKGIWSSGYGYESRRLNALTTGLVGFGNIAKKTAQYVKAFEMDVVAYDPYVEDGVFDEHGVKRVSLDELFAVSDAVFLHAPLTPETKYLICKDSIAKMKDGVFIINCSRGALVCTDDLMDALDSGKVAAAGLDVIEGEPISGRDDLPMFSRENLLLTPHSAYISRESTILQHETIAETVIKVLINGETPYNIVNKKQF